MNDITLCQFIDHTCNSRKLICCILSGCCPQVADRVTGCFSVISVPLTALCSLTYIFLCCFVISHSCSFLRMAKVRRTAIPAKYYQIYSAKLSPEPKVKLLSWYCPGTPSTRLVSGDPEQITKLLSTVCRT